MQCREKIKKLRAEYKKVKDHNDETGRDRKTFVYFDRLDDLLGHRPATQPQHFLDTSADLIEKSPEEPTPLPATSDEEDSSFQEEASYTARAEEQDKQPDVDDTKQTEKDSPKGKQTKTDKKRKRPARDGMMEKVMDAVVTKIVKIQEDSDGKMFAIEEKRMELDERMMEMEERHWQQQQEREERYRREQQDRDEQRRREDRQFQLQMMQMMCGRPSFASPSSFNVFDDGSSAAGCSTSERMYNWPHERPNQ